MLSFIRIRYQILLQCSVRTATISKRNRSKWNRKADVSAERVSLVFNSFMIVYAVTGRRGHNAVIATEQATSLARISPSSRSPRIPAPKITFRARQ